VPRLARAIAVGCAHHITQRGNNRQDVFFVDEDRRVYLELLKEQARKYGLEVLAYCLMTIPMSPHKGPERLNSCNS
jgi:putative transposase